MTNDYGLSQEKTMKKEAKKALIREARVEFADSTIQIDDNAKISGTEKAAWVAAWVWVELDELRYGLQDKPKENKE
jgi:hypothetical protein